MSAPNPSYKPSEGKREEFRKYLEKNGVTDALTRVLVNLYEEVEKPDDALEYIRDKLAVFAGLETNKQLQIKLNDAEERNKELEAQLAQIPEGQAGELPAQGSSTQPGDVPVEEDVLIKTEENAEGPAEAEAAAAPEEFPNADQQ